MSMYGAEIALCDINKQQFATKYLHERKKLKIKTHKAFYF
jgi:hypothetical protein